MKTLKKHILLEFLKVFTLTLAAFLTIFMLVEAVEKGDDLLEHGVPLRAALGYFIFKAPVILEMVMPVALLLSVLLTLGVLNRHGEVTAIKAGGVSISSALSPLFACGLVLSVLALLATEFVTPIAKNVVASIEDKWLKGETARFGSGGLWLRSGNSFQNIRRVDRAGPEGAAIEGIVIYEFERPFNLKTKTLARRAEWKDSAWVAPSAELWSYTPGSAPLKEEKNDLVLPGLPPPEELLGAEKSIEDMSFTELSAYIRGLNKEGYDTSRYRVELYTKVTMPFLNFIMVLLAVPFALRSGRNSGIAGGVVVSVAIAFTYWIVLGMAKSLGSSGILPPFIAALLPDAVFLALGVLLFGYVKQ